MKRRNTHRNRTSSTANGAEFFSWTHFAITAIAAIVLAAGLFFAASQHFNSMELGIKNAKLRSQLGDLENEKRRLELSREIALTPAELKRSAKTLGFREAGELALITAKPQAKVVASDTVIEVAKAGDEKIVATKTVADSRVRPEVKTVGEVRPLKAASKTSGKEGKATPDSRPRIVLASAQAPQADTRKLVKKTVSSTPTNRTSDKLR